MLKELLQKKGVSVYRASKDTGIAYTTLNDLVIEKTEIKNTSVEVLYRLANYLGLSMEHLYEDAYGKQSSSGESAMEDDMYKAETEKGQVSKKSEPTIGIWWWDGEIVFGVSVAKENGADIGGLIHYSEKENHVTLWKKALHSVYPAERAMAQYAKGFKSLYRGRVYYDPKTACYTITCSEKIIGDKAFRAAVTAFYGLSESRREFLALHHYEYLRELTGNDAIDADYYESSY